MKQDALQGAEKYTKAHQRKKRWYRVVTGLACVVVFCTVYALILPAITMEKEVCETPEHTHSESCYAQVTSVTRTEPVCTIESLNLHLHDDTCYDSEGKPTCGYADFVIHRHDSACYDENGNLWCPLPEIETHTHTESCYSVPEAPAEVHTHTDECYAVERGELICTEHIHTDDCYTEVSALICTVDHEHNESCYKPRLELTCGIDSDHQHTDACYEQIKTLICDLSAESEDEEEPAQPELICVQAEVILHEHTSDCYDDSDNLICGKIQVLEHQHTDACFETVEEPVDTEALTCTLPEDENHTHTALCYGTWELICGLEEHRHSEACEIAELTDENQARVDAVIARIEALPTSEEVEEILAAYEETGDEEGYEMYFLEVSQQAQTVYAYYEDLGPALQELVTNRDKLLELSWLWSAAPLAITDTVTVYQVNQYSQSSVTTLVYGGSIRDKLGSSGMSFSYWDVVVVEKDSSGKLYVDQYITADGDKRDYQATTADGFVLLLYNTSLNVNKDDEVTVDFNYKTSGPYNSDGYGTVSFGSTAGPKPDKDNSNKLTIVPGADTRELIEVNLYDYNSSINTLYNSDKNYPGFQQDKGSTDVGDTFNRYQSFNFGNNITADLSAGKPNVTNQGGTINTTTNGANSPISGAMQSKLGNDGYPALSDGTSLGYLFSNSGYAQKQNQASINGLFRYNETTGAYTFNSRENHAQFNPGSDTFTLYQQIISSNFMMYPFGNFLPFNDIVTKSAQTSTIDRAYLQTIANSAQYKNNQGAGDEYGTLAAQLNQFIKLMDEAYGTSWTATDAMNKYFALNNIPREFASSEPLLQNLYSIDYDEPTDFFFGMEMKMNFMQPKNGITGPGNDQQMVFYFTGDDDVWVYIDNVLFLDLSGIHRHVGGEIDFVRGEVKYYDLDVSTGDVSTTASKTVKFCDLVDSTKLNSAGTFVDYSTHSFNFYYMERGAGSGVCRMNFNFPLLRQNTISVTKELSVDEADKLDLLGNPDFRFQILKANSSDPFIDSGVEYDILDTAGNKIGTGTTGTDGVFLIKANQTAVFNAIEENSGRYFVRELLEPDAFQQYGKITVDGSTVTTGTGSEVIVGSDTFKGVDSPVKDMSDGNTAFHFDNEITFNKLGHLKITKKLETYPQTREMRQFQFAVTLDGAPLPVGTEYTVGEVQRVVTEAGMIVLAPDETAVISNILAGSRFTVQETATSGAGYTVAYTGSDLKQETNESGFYVSGVIKTDTAVAVIVTNSERGAAVTIPGTKTLTNPSEAPQNFTFQLEQITDSSGSTVVEGGTLQTVSVCLPGENGENSAAFQFQLSYLEKDIASLPVNFYYKITEVMERPDQIRYDPAVYIAKITVTRQTDENGGGGELAAVLTNLWKNGIATTDPAVSFTNTLIGDLTITKQVIGGNSPDTEFRFTITLKQGDTPLSDTLSAVRSTAAGETLETVSLDFDENGQANITLKHAESLKICGIPLGTVWSVAETDADGYSVSYQVDSADAAGGKECTGTLTETGATITFTNAVQYELPNTGGAGTVPYTIGGFLLLTVAAFLLLYNHTKRRKEDSASS